MLADEPAAARSVAAGAALVCFSGDKLLGGPQAGLIVGTSRAVDAARTHPLARAMRIDKLSLAALEATLILYRDPALARREVPVLSMLAASEDELAARAQRLAERNRSGRRELTRATAQGRRRRAAADSSSRGRSSRCALRPTRSGWLPTLRVADPPVIARMHDGRLLLDPRTLRDDEIDACGPGGRRGARADEKRVETAFL